MEALAVRQADDIAARAWQQSEPAKSVALAFACVGVGFLFVAIGGWLVIDAVLQEFLKELTK